MKELEALKKSGLFRERKLFKKGLLDFASNDYLGLSENSDSFLEAIKRLGKGGLFASKASMLVNGYSEMHRGFEKKLAKSFGFESCALFGSGFLANIGLFEALGRKKSAFFVDSEYHASGILGSKLLQGELHFFDRSDLNSLKNAIEISKAESKYIAIEGIYSMSGKVAPKEIVEIADAYSATLIVDEAHSSGVIGERLFGFFDHYGIKPKSNHIKMGTLSKAYASYGAFVCASDEMISFLENRAKPLIYSTALSLFDTVLAEANFDFIKKHAKSLKKSIEKQKEMAKCVLGMQLDSLIVPIETNRSVVEIQKELSKKGFVVGAIRPPTVERQHLRVILRIANKKKDTNKLLEELKSVSV